MIRRVIFGCGHLTGGASQSTATQLVRRCLQAGISCFDIAPCYGLGTAETALGRALRDVGGIAEANTKVGLSQPRNGIVKSYLRSARRGLFKAGLLDPTSPPRSPSLLEFNDPNLPRGSFDAATVCRVFKASQRALAPGRIASFHLHEAYPQNVHEGALSALRMLRDEGQVDQVGVANGCLHGSAVDEFVPSDFLVQAAAPPGLFTRDVALAERHVIHSVFTSFRWRMSTDVSFRRAAGSTMARFDDILGRGVDAEVILSFLLAGTAAPKSNLIFATGDLRRLEVFLCAVDTAFRDGVSEQVIEYFMEQYHVLQT